MEEILVAILQFLFETVLNLGLFEPLDVGTSRRRETNNNAVTTFWWLFAGAVLGGASLLVFDHTMIRRPDARIVAVVVMPLFSGAVSFLISALRSKRNPLVTPRHHFWFAFWFSLAFGIVRFTYACRACG